MADNSGVDYGQINTQIIDPAQYRAFFKSNNQVDYSKIADDLGVMLDTEVKRRDAIKKDIDDNTNSLVDQLGQIETNSDSVFSDSVINMATQARDNLMTYNRALKAGKTTPSQYKQYLERVKTQMNKWNGVTKSFGAYYDKSMGRINTTSEATGEMQASPFEVTIGRSVHGFGKSAKNSEYLDPVTGQAFYYKRTKDGRVPDFKKNPELFTSIDNFSSNMAYEQDRDQFNIDLAVKADKEFLGTITDSYILKFGKKGERGGRYIMTTEDYTIMANDPDFQSDIEDLRNNIYKSLTSQGGGVGLGQSVATMNSDFKVVLSKAEFQEQYGKEIDNPDYDADDDTSDEPKRIPNPDYVDEKYMVIIDPKNPNGLSVRFGDKSFAEAELKKGIEKSVAMQLGGSRKASSLSYEPNEDSSATTRDEKKEREIGYAKRVNNIMSADAITAASDMEDTIKELNRDEFNESRGITIDQIDRQENGINIERTKKGKEDDTFISYYQLIDGKPDLTKPRPAKQIAKEIYRDLIPNSITQNISFDAWYNQAIEEDPNMFTPHLMDNPDFDEEAAETPFGGTNAKLIKNPNFKGSELTSTVESFETIDSYKATDDFFDTTGAVTASTSFQAIPNEPGNFEQASSVVKTALGNAWRNIPDTNLSVTYKDVKALFGESTNEIIVSYKDPLDGAVKEYVIKYDADNTKLESDVENIANKVIKDYNQKNANSQFGGSGVAGGVDTSKYN